MTDGVVIIDKMEAIKRSIQEGLDLVLVQDGDIPVVKICDANKIQYSKQKSTHVNKPKKVKHVQIGPHTAEHDLGRLAVNAKEFMEDGHPVVLQMTVRGRDRMFIDLIEKQIGDFVKRIPNCKLGKLTRSDDGGTFTQSLTN